MLYVLDATLATLWTDPRVALPRLAGLGLNRGAALLPLQPRPTASCLLGTTLRLRYARGLATAPSTCRKLLDSQDSIGKPPPRSP